MDKYANSIQYYWSDFTSNWAFNIPNFYAMVQRNTQIITGTNTFAYNRGQQHQTHQNFCILQKIPQMQISMANMQITNLST